jgi:hypothetical protein
MTLKSPQLLLSFIFNSHIPQFLKERKKAFPSLIQKHKMATRKKPLSLNDRHYRLLQDLSAPPKPSSKLSSGTPSFPSLSLTILFFFFLKFLD